MRSGVTRSHKPGTLDHQRLRYGRLQRGADRERRAGEAEVVWGEVVVRAIEAPDAGEAPCSIVAAGDQTARGQLFQSFRRDAALDSEVVERALVPVADVSRIAVIHRQRKLRLRQREYRSRTAAGNCGCAKLYADVG